MCAFLGVFLSDGSASGSRGGKTALANGDYIVHLSKRVGVKGGDKGDVREKIISLVQRLGYKYGETESGIYIRSKQLWSRLIGLGFYETKYIPDEYKNLPPEKLRTLLEWMFLCDGTIRGQERLYYTVSKQLADDVQEDSA
jgi:hypothetical protein